jgi:hypothetical protein
VALTASDPFTVAADKAAADARARRDERFEAMAEGLRRQGADVTSVRPIRKGYVVVARERDDALTAGQIALGAFGGDHESGLPMLTLEPAGEDGWSMAVEVEAPDGSNLDPSQRVARTAALQSVWEQMEDARKMGWVDEMEVRCERPDPDTFVTSTKGVLAGHVRRRTWTSGDDRPTEVADFPATTEVV